MHLHCCLLKGHAQSPVTESMKKSKHFICCTTDSIACSQSIQRGVQSQVPRPLLVFTHTVALGKSSHDSHSCQSASGIQILYQT